MAFEKELADALMSRRVSEALIILPHSRGATLQDAAVPSGSHPSKPDEASSPKRRKERRYQVDLHGELYFEGKVFAVQITDISESGALLFLHNPPPAGTEAELWIEDFGSLPVVIIHSGEFFCGIALCHPAKYPDEMLEWLRRKASTQEPAASTG